MWGYQWQKRLSGHWPALTLSLRGVGRGGCPTQFPRAGLETAAAAAAVAAEVRGRGR